MAKSVAYTLDGLGQIVKRDETRVNASGTPLPNEAAPVELFYRFAGKTMGMVGNNGTGDVSYDASITARSAASPAITSTNAGLFRNGTNTGSSFYADFSQSIDPYNSGQQGSAGGGTYSVRSGDTLQGIAAALYGDGNLWYRIAEANGLSAGAALSEGQSLILPAGVTKNTHNASTFQPYDAAEAMGDTLPTTPKPPKSPKCGGFGAILMVAIAEAVTIATHGAMAQFAAGLGLGAGGAGGAALAAGTIGTIGSTGIAVGSAAGIAGGVLAAAAGSVVSQGFGVATGIQDKFSFKQVALAGVSSLAGSAAGGLVKLGTAVAASGFAKVAGDVVRGALSSALSQGVSVAAGLQKSFSWTNVATAGIGAGVAGAASRSVGGQAHIDADGNRVDASFGNMAAGTMADTIAQAATRSAIKGNSFGDNLLASLPSALGNLAGRALAAGVGTAFDGKSSGDNAKTVHSVNDPLKVETPVGNAGAQAGADSTSANGGQVDEGIIVNAMRLSPAEKRRQIEEIKLNGIRYFHSPNTFRDPNSQWVWTRQGGIRPKTAADTAPQKPLKKASSERIDKAAAEARAERLAAAEARAASEARTAKLARLQAEESRTTARLHEDQLTKHAMPAELQLAGDYGSFDSITAFVSENWDDIPLAASHGFTISDYRNSFDALSSWSSSWLDRGLQFAENQAQYLPPDQRFRMIATSNLLSSLGQGIAAIPSAAAHPFNSGKAFFGGIARGFDSVMAINDTPAKDYIPAQISRAANASPDDWARFTGKLGAAVFPAKFLPGAKYAPELAFAPTKVHGNSLGYVGDTHVYVVRGPDGAWKIGESMQGTRLNGNMNVSIRGEMQAQQLRTKTGQFYESQLRNGGKSFATKAEARAYETKFIETFRRIYGTGPKDRLILPGNKTNR